LRKLRLHAKINQMIQENVRILEHEKLAPKYFLLTLSSDHISKSAKPGQFVNVKVSDGIIPLLRRPLSIHDVDAKNKTFKLLYEVVGPGTKILSARKVGEEISVLGPLGSGFKIEKDILILVAGGMGIAPLGFFAHEALKNKKKVHVFIGAKTKELVLCEDGLKLLGAEVTVATEDGSYGEKGLITDLLHSRLTTNNLSAEGGSASGGQLTTIYSCGPKGMLKEVASIAKQNKIGCQISMEAYMACGIGACKGCPVETVNGYKMVCKDGPIFNAEEIKW